MSLYTDILELLDTNVAATSWGTDHIYDAANAAQLELYCRTRHKKTSANLEISTGDTIITMPVTSIMIPQYITYDELGYYSTTIVELENWSRSWQGETAAKPQTFIRWDWSHLRVWPTSDADYTYTLDGVPWPTEIAAGNLDISDDRTFVRAVAYEAAARLLDNRIPQFAEIMRMNSKEHEHEFVRRTRNRHGHRIRRLRPVTLGATYAGSIKAIKGSKSWRG